jgi:hypothetical protein
MPENGQRDEGMLQRILSIRIKAAMNGLLTVYELTCNKRSPYNPLTVSAKRAPIVPFCHAV